jgi:hypothetical protein
MASWDAMVVEQERARAVQSADVCAGGQRKQFDRLPPSHHPDHGDDTGTWHGLRIRTLATILKYVGFGVIVVLPSSYSGYHIHNAQSDLWGIFLRVTF